MQVISQTAEYALRATIWLLQEPSLQQTTRQIAEGTRTPPGYISKVLQLLAKSGLVQSHRGSGGGYQFTGDPKGITVLDVIDAVDELHYIRSCPLGLEEHRTHLCPLHQGINEVTSQMEKTFGDTTLYSLLHSDSPSIPLGIKSLRKGKKPTP